MARKSQYKRKAPAKGRRQWKRKAWGRQHTTNVNRALRPFPARFITKMKYAEQLNVVGGIGAAFTSYRFNLNSIYDPNRTGFGHQPYGRDEANAIYNRYRVISCSYTISSFNSGSSGDGYSIIAALPSNQEVVLSGGLAQAQETPRCKFITQAPNATLKVLKGTVYMPSLTGLTKAQYMADDRYQAQMDADPNETLILNIFTGAITGASETNTAKLSVVLEYTVELFDPKQLPGS